MKYIDEYRNGAVAQAVAAQIQKEATPARHYRFMEFCGGHTHAIFRYGIETLLPSNVEMVHGPGCPVCVLPIGRVDMAVQLAQKPGVILASYADMLRVPGSGKVSLLTAKARGADVRMVYSTLDALEIARQNPNRQVAFFAIGFETTTPMSASALLQAQAQGLTNFSLFCNHVMTPPAMRAILGIEGVPLDGFVGPSHVSTIIGTRAYRFVPDAFGKPVVISGFEPLDVLQAILMLVRQVNSGRAEVENEFARAVGEEGNVKAQTVIDRVFQVRDRFEWRGLGAIPSSALELRPEWHDWDAERRFDLEPIVASDHPACQCASVLRGQIKPQDCKVFATACTPETPLGSCMVSSEGACAAYYRYGRHQSAG
ncbi:MAG: hydrogenase formation protein HypD [Alphaproteobacteria bacterium CG_4_10_14_0_2_um_filter_63_37]|nr:MAG: hydrogenase formation protein HypD [Proteobacteria bacterium CG1_02_64_396]PJA24252.1 MAG: hydrogenase formation protein HypD [Alphaproteobacteria bacterium CG_4_10_14_0_2_um_filter_63_37]